MKNTLNKFAVIAIVSAACLSLSSCATMFAKKKAPVVLMNGGGVTVSENGTNLQVEKVFAHGTAGYNKTMEYYAQGVMLDKKQKYHTLTLQSGGKTGTVKIKLGAGINWIVLDTFIGGPIGWGIDAATAKWRVARNKYIDVEAVLNGTKPMSQGKLKRMMKKEAKGNTTVR